MSRSFVPKIAIRSLAQRRIEVLEPRHLMALAPLAPIAVDDHFQVGEDQVLVGNVIAGNPLGNSDVSASGLPSQIVEINGQPAGDSSFTLPSGSMLEMAADGSFRYDPASSADLSSLPAGENGTDGFEYTLAPAFSDVVIFGDSLSDQGRLFAATGGLFPPDPPYFQGRQSNGPAWIESLAPRLGLSVSLANNLAVNGATTGTANYLESILGTDLPGLADELNSFLSNLGGQPADSDALYVVWAGANDFFLPLDDPAAVIGQAVTNLATTVGTLQAVGAEHIVMMNLPDLGLTPFGIGSGQSAQLTALSAAFNSALDATLASLGLDVTLVDVFARFHQIVADPGSFGLTDVSQPAFDGVTVIGDPEQFLFWDSVHPTAAGHRLIAQAVFEQLTDEATVSIDIADATTPPELWVENFPGDQPGEITLVLAAVDDSPADAEAQFRYEIDWGDASGVETVIGSALGTSATHSYHSGAAQQIAITVFDQDGDASQQFRELVVWGTPGSDRLFFQPLGRDRLRVRLNCRSVATIDRDAVDRLVVFGLRGNDWISAGGVGVPVEFDGGPGHDRLVGGQCDDVLRGGPGHDRLFGLLGDDQLWGGEGYDQLYGGSGENWLDGTLEPMPRRRRR